MREDFKKARSRAPPQPHKSRKPGRSGRTSKFTPGPGSYSLDNDRAQSIRKAGRGTTFGGKLANTTREAAHSIAQPGLPKEPRPVRNQPGPGHYENDRQQAVKKRTKQFKFDRAGRNAISGVEQPGLPGKITKTTLANPGPQYNLSKPLSLPPDDKTGRAVHSTASFTSFGGNMAKMTREHGRLMCQPDLPLYHGSQKGPGPGAYDHFSDASKSKGGRDAQKRKVNYGEAKRTNLEGMSTKPRTTGTKVTPPHKLSFYAPS